MLDLEIVHEERKKKTGIRERVNKKNEEFDRILAQRKADGLFIDHKTGFSVNNKDDLLWQLCPYFRTTDIKKLKNGRVQRDVTICKDARWMDGDFVGTRFIVQENRQTEEQLEGSHRSKIGKWSVVSEEIVSKRRVGSKRCKNCKHYKTMLRALARRLQTDETTVRKFLGDEQTKLLKELLFNETGIDYDIIDDICKTQMFKNMARTKRAIRRKQQESMTIRVTYDE